VELVLEARYNPKVAAPATKAPEEVPVLLFARSHHAPVRRDNIHREDVVAAPAISAREITEAAPEREARDARIGDKAEHRGKTVNLCLAVHITQEAAGLGAGRAGDRVHPHAPHERHVQQQSSVADGKSRNIVTPALDG
jgi:hypothetical protein